MLAKPVITQPNKPFVTIFFHAGGDATPYGFVVGGKMTEADWREVLSHVGFLSPYSIFKPGNSAQWRNHGFDVAVRAAQRIGRPTGGSIMGIPGDKHEQDNVRDAYSQPIGLDMTHFFHDDEHDLGVPGGSGKTRLRIEPNRRGARLEAPMQAGPGRKGAASVETWQMSFGANFGDYLFGGQTTVMGNDMDNGDADGLTGWRIMFMNTGGYHGHNNIVFVTRAGEYVSSRPFSARLAMGWLKVKIRISRDPDSRHDDVKIAIDGVGARQGRIAKAQYYGGKLYVGDPQGVKREVHYDDLVISALRRGRRIALGHYTFERGHVPGGMVLVKDVSGFGQDLSPVDDEANALQLEGTDGIRPALFSRIKQSLVDDLLAVRKAHGRPAPVLITNWALDDLPGRFSHWRAAGFTNGSTDYYLSGELRAGESPIEHILRERTRRTQWAWHDGSRWTHAWLGQTTVRASTLSPRDYGALVTLAVLDGNRWFSVFTAMSRGRLGRRGLPLREQALVNADALYDMAAAASRFQGTRKGLRDSVYVGQRPLMTPLVHGVFRARENTASKELWFAAYRPADAGGKHERPLKVRLPGAHGVVINLASGRREPVDGGVFELPVGDDATPYYFSPSARDGG